MGLHSLECRHRQDKPLLKRPCFIRESSGEGVEENSAWLQSGFSHRPPPAAPGGAAPSAAPRRWLPAPPRTAPEPQPSPRRSRIPRGTADPHPPQTISDSPHEGDRRLPPAPDDRGQSPRGRQTPPTCLFATDQMSQFPTDPLWAPPDPCTYY